MANELSRQASDDYMEDIMKHMKRMEVRTPWHFLHEYLKG
jgi:hypothetical protein